MEKEPKADRNHPSLSDRASDLLYLTAEIAQENEQPITTMDLLKGFFTLAHAQAASEPIADYISVTQIDIQAVIEKIDSQAPVPSQPLQEKPRITQGAAEALRHANQRASASQLPQIRCNHIIDGIQKEFISRGDDVIRVTGLHYEEIIGLAVLMDIPQTPSFTTRSRPSQKRYPRS